MNEIDKEEELIYDLLIDNFPWIIELFDDVDRPLEDVINFLGGLAYSYGYKAGQVDFLKERKKTLYDPKLKEQKKIYEN